MSKRETFLIKAFFVIAIIFVGVVATQVINHVSEHGLDSVAERVWKGRQ